MEWVRNLFLIMFSIGVFLFALSIILIFALKIPDLLDELSGRKAKRQIKRLKELNIGTGAIEEMGTDDVYMSVSSGNLLGEDITVKKAHVVESPIINTDDQDSEESQEDEENIATTEMSEESSKTEFIDDAEDDVKTEFIDEDATGILQEIQDFCESKHIIEIVEEQTSL